MATTECPSCKEQTLTVSIFGSICSKCFWENGDPLEGEDA